MTRKKVVTGHETGIGNSGADKDHTRQKVSQGRR